MFKSPANRTMSTSLQRSLQKSQDEKRLKKYETSNGNFESCFANGLDLSEFASSSSSNDGLSLPKRESAAAELLRIKKLEIEKQRREEMEEQTMTKVIQRRAQNMKKSLMQQKRQQQSAGGNSVLVNALVSMHQGDEVRAFSSASQRKLKKKLSSNRLPSPTSMCKTKDRNNNTSSSSKRQLHKKSRQTKF